MNGGVRRWVCGILLFLILSVLAGWYQFSGARVNAPLGPADPRPGGVQRAAPVASPVPAREVALQDLGLRPAGTLRIAGRVATANGNVLGGVRIRAYASGGEFIAEGTSDSAGAFELTGLAAGKLAFLRAEKAGYGPVPEAPTEGRVELTLSTVADFEIVLGPELSVLGMVVNKDGFPRPFVQVFARRLDGLNLVNPCGTSTEYGDIALRGLAPGDYEFCFRRGESFVGASPGPQRVRLSRNEAVTDLRIACPDGAGYAQSISGVVTDPQGVPVLGAEIWAEGRGRIAVTDAGGRYAAGLLSQERRIGARHAYYSDSTVETIESGASTVNFVLRAPSAVEGRVVDGQSGRPVTEFRVRVGAGTGVDEDYAIVRDGEGRFAVKNVKAGPASAYVVAGGFADTSMVLASLMPGETRRGVEVRLQPGCEVKGRVVDSAEQPIRQATVRFEATGGQTVLIRRRTSGTTDAQGRFRLESVPVGSIRIVAEHERYVSKSILLNVVPGTAGELRVVLDAGASVRGRLSRGGEPAGFGEAEIFPAMGPARHGAIGPDGRFEIGGVSPGPAHIRIRGNWEHESVVTEKRIHVEGSEPQDLRIDLASATAMVAGTVYTAPNELAASPMTVDGHTTGGRVHIAPGEVATTPMTVVAYATDGGGGVVTMSGTVDPDGRYRMKVPAGNVRLGAGDGRGEMKYVGVHCVKDETVQQDIHLSEGATLYVDVLHPGDPRSTRLYLLDGEVEASEISTEWIDTLRLRIAGLSGVGSEGQGTFRAIEPGTYTVLVLIAERDPESGMEEYRQWNSKVVSLGAEDELITLDLAERN